MNKRLVLAAATVVIAGSSLGAAGVALADAQPANNMPGHGRHRDGERGERREDRSQRLNGRLNQAVADGVITKAQRDAFQAELQKLHDQQRTSAHNATTRAERKAAHDAFKTNLEAWAKANNFPLDKVMPGPVHDKQ